MLTVPVEGRPGRLLVRWLRWLQQKYHKRWFVPGSTEANATDREFAQFLKEAQTRYLDAGRGREEAMIAALAAPDIDLRARLLSANQELYGEYDRLIAEGAFRINLVPPLIALSIVAGTNFYPLWAILPAAVGVVLLVQGTTRLASAQTVLRRAVLAGVVVHPAVLLVQEQEEQKARLLEAEEQAVARQRERKRYEREQDEARRIELEREQDELARIEREREKTSGPKLWAQ